MDIVINNIRRLSDSKILVTYIAKIYSFGIVVDEVKLSIRYKIIDDELEIIYLKPKFYNKLSNRFGIKKNLMGTSYSYDFSILFEGVVYNKVKFITNFELFDKVWLRDFKLNQLLTS